MNKSIYKITKNIQGASVKGPSKGVIKMENINNAVNTGFNLEAIDKFKKYTGLEGRYIIENYIRHKCINSVLESYDELVDALDVMDELDDLGIRDDYQLGYVTDSGYPSFHIDY